MRLALQARSWPDHAAYRRWAQPRQEALNHALRGIPPAQVRYHVCWGSQNHPHVSDAPLKDIVELVLQVHASATYSRPPTLARAPVAELERDQSIRQQTPGSRACEPRYQHG